jgi:hypothetical protein
MAGNSVFNIGTSKASSLDNYMDATIGRCNLKPSDEDIAYRPIQMTATSVYWDPFFAASCLASKLACIEASEAVDL